MKKQHIVVIGGGASGIVAAITAAREGAIVTLLEQKDRIGKKILSTGNGKCNLTNEYMSDECFRGDDLAIVGPVLAQFAYHKTCRFFEELGLILKSRQGYIYPISDQASAVLDVLRMELYRLSVDIQTNAKVVRIEKKESFKVYTSSEVFSADKVILATGGMASKVLGSDGSGYPLAKSMGHHISEVVPALVALQAKEKFFASLSGIRTNAKITLYVDDMQVAEDVGELQLTNYGISGIPVFQVSRFAAKAFTRNKKVMVEIDYIPTMNERDFARFMCERKEQHAHKTAEEFCVGVLHKKLGITLLKLAGIKADFPIHQVKEKSFRQFLYLCKHFQTEIVATNSFDQAQVCAGGVKTKEINPHTMESIKTPGLYLTGELLDIDGICGGYNLQWAWSTGYIAGMHAAKGI